MATKKTSASSRSKSTARKAAPRRGAAASARRTAVKKAPAKRAPAKAAAKRAAAKAPAKRAAVKPAAVKRAPAKRAPAKKAAAKKAAAKKVPAKKVLAKKAAVKKAAVKRAPPRKAAVKKAPPKQAAVKKVAVKKVAVKKVAVKKVAVKKASPFKVGDKVVYPHHGAAVITRKEKREFGGSRTDFFVLQVAIDQLILRVPVSRAAELGVRPVISRTAARRVLSTFRTEPEEAGANWSRWYKLLTEKITSGDIYQVAEVVRDLTHAQQTKGISPALKRMLSKARLILASELRFALDLSEEDAMKRLDKALPKADSDEEE